MHRIILVGFLGLFVAGCSQQPGDKASTAANTFVATPTSFNSAGAPTVEFSVPDMMCPEGCGAAVKDILSKQPGAQDVLVDFDAKTATVAVDKDKFDADKALADLVDHQFNNSALKNDAVASAGAKSQSADAATVQ